MKALSIHPAYALEILKGQKTEEYRTWSTNYRGDLLICATAKKTLGTISGHALCVVRLDAIRALNDGTYAWVLTNLRYLEPFKIKGKQRLYTIEDQMIQSALDKIDRENQSPQFEIVWERYYEQFLE
ncbi:ASCH domain-containing protein [Enterococcus hermanniensis]|uniref:ASCH domain-containing protein n=1 Tax=Enterococcus hermanniensis TaxID=249189 RepID=A0A1L8TM38_9ENTE|nr:ASCH domain-containing protein [Enterococcus hermanniensis]OJG45381.1 hypothetical protein RV04_GL002097 [Enterococcus hermanniensis]